MPLVEPLQDRRRLQRSLNVAPQKGLDLLGPYLGERVRSSSPPSLAILLRRQPASLPRPCRPHAHTRCCCRPLVTLICDQSGTSCTRWSPPTTGKNSQRLPAKVIVADHPNSSMRLSTTPGAGLYFASSPRSLAKSVSSSGYGRYSSTSRAHFDALLMPASSNAAASSERLALLADRVPGTAPDVPVSAIWTAELSGAGEDRLDLTVGTGATADGVVPVEGASPLHAASAAIVRAATSNITGTRRSMADGNSPETSLYGSESSVSSRNLLVPVPDISDKHEK